MITGTLSRYFGMQFLRALIGVFAGVFLLVTLIDYIEMMRRAAGEREVSSWIIAQISLYRVPQLTERIMPFAVLIGAMSCYLGLSRKNELVVARSAGISAWQFIAPALVVALFTGALATAIYNPLAANLHERSKRLESQMLGNSSGRQSSLQSSGTGFWLRQKSSDGQSIIHALTNTDQGMRLGGVTAFTFSPEGTYQERIEAKSATLADGYWQLRDARVYGGDDFPVERPTYQLKTNLTSEQVRENFATPESVPFWDLPSYIESAERAGLGASGYKLQYHKLIARPFLLCAMVLLASAVSLRFFRFGGVQKMVLSGIVSGFLLYVLSKVVEDLSKAELMPPIAAAWLPVIVGMFTGFVVLLHQEDG
jgi:lipopolysaccharide export system permease protein